MNLKGKIKEINNGIYQKNKREFGRTFKNEIEQEMSKGIVKGNLQGLEKGI